MKEKVKNIIFISCVLLFFGLVLAATSLAAPTGDQVKVAMVYNLAKFVDWPDSVFVDSQSPLVVCWLGSESFQGDLSALQGKTLKNRSVVVRRAGRLEDVGTCHILIVSSEFNKEIAEIRGLAKQSSVFTVSDMSGFVQKGGMIEFDNKGGKIQFNVNLLSIKDSQLGISAQVLKLAVDVIE